MTPQQLEDLEYQWRSLRYKKLGEIIEMKLSAQSVATDKFLADMELERRKFVRDVMIDRFLAGISVIIALVALLVSLWTLVFPKSPPESTASQPAVIFQSATTNK
jgi:hypothetical protein